MGRGRVRVRMYNGLVEGGFYERCVLTSLIRKTDEGWHTLPASCYQSLARVHQIMWAMTYVMVNYLSTGPKSSSLHFSTSPML